MLNLVKKTVVTAIACLFTMMLFTSGSAMAGNYLGFSTPNCSGIPVIDADNPIEACFSQRGVVSWWDYAECHPCDF
ncbi:MULTISPECIES: hypothetical protein [Moorena]|uniref:hypothetical protein n=1 Tax=Moorena TaxID=1155738 RepID=UPI001056D5D7|nr:MULTISPECIES: hypothetical protein [Moorena]NEP69585.1 hypothetical protein [Moorena sp. SIO3A5]